MTGLARQLQDANPSGEPSAKQQIMAVLDSKMKRIESLMPPGIIADPRRMAATVMVEIERNPRLAECTPESLIGCVVRVSQMGLEVGPDLGQAFFVPRRNSKKGIVECTLQWGYPAVVVLCLRSPDITKIIGRAVHEVDDFHYAFGTSEHLHHKPAEGMADDAAKGEVTHAYGLVWTTKGGPPLFNVIDRPEIERRRARGDNGPAWRTDYAAMAAKSAILAMKRWLPLTTQVAQALAGDGAAITVTAHGPEVLEAHHEEAEPPRQVDAGTGEISPPPPAPPVDDGAPPHSSPIGEAFGDDLHVDLARLKVPTPLHGAVILRASGGRTWHAAELYGREAGTVERFGRDCAAAPREFCEATVQRLRDGGAGSEIRVALKAWLEETA